ncbi:MAG: penicillin-binding protein activator [Alphaproteobacteria bacterium]
MLQIFEKSNLAVFLGNGALEHSGGEEGRRSVSGRMMRGLLAAGLVAFVAACSTDGPDRPRERDTSASDFPQFDIPRAPEGRRDSYYNAPHMEGRNPVRVGLLLPFSAESGGVRELSRALQDAAQMALSQSGTRNVLLIPKDTRGTAVGAREAAEAAIEAGAEIILGPVFADNVTSAAHIAVPEAVPLIAFSSNRKVAQPGVYLLSFQAEEEIRRVVNYALSQELYDFAALVPANSYGELSSDALSRTVFQAGGTVTNVVAFEPGSDDYRSSARELAEFEQRAEALKQHINELKVRRDDEAEQELARLEKQETYGDVSFQAVLIPAGGTTLRSVAPLLTYFDVDNREVRFLGTSLWNDPALWKEPALAGGWFAAPSPEQRRAFSQSFEDIFGYKPPRLTSLGYDAVLLTAVLSRDAEQGERFTDERLTNPSGFAGVDGIFRFRTDGTTERGIAVLEIQDGDVEVVSPAPTRFDAEAVY